MSQLIGAKNRRKEFLSSPILNFKPTRETGRTSYDQLQKELKLEYI